MGSVSTTGNHACAHAGFTLFELVAVIAIIAVLAGLMVPSMGMSSGRNIDDVAERLVMFINHARQESVFTSRVWRVVFDPVADTIDFQRYSSSGFISIDLQPFQEGQSAGVDIESLEINGQLLQSGGIIGLYPGGEQDAFRLTLGKDDKQGLILMGSVGPAEYRRP